MVEQGIVPNTTNYNGLIGACSKNKKLVRESCRFALPSCLPVLASTAFSSTIADHGSAVGRISV
jgi:hypothetical protein